MTTEELITYLLPVLVSVLGGLGLPRVIRELRGLNLARTVNQLARAAIEHPEWSDQRFNSVLRLVRDVDRNSSPRLPAADERTGESDPPAPGNQGSAQ